jgi:hypothetical protein
LVSSLFLKKGFYVRSFGKNRFLLSKEKRKIKKGGISVNAYTPTYIHTYIRNMLPCNDNGTYKEIAVPTYFTLK